MNDNSMRAATVVPTALKIVAFLFVLDGADAAIQMLVGLLSAHTKLDLGLINLWIGFGLFRLNSRMFRWARFISKLELAVFVVAMTILPFGEGPHLMKIFGVPVATLSLPAALVLFALLALLTLWQLSVLNSPEIAQLFDPANEPASSTAHQSMDFDQIEQIGRNR